MPRFLVCAATLLALFLLTFLAPPARGQSYSQTARAFVQEPAALGMGDAGVAFPTETTAFFYNPAHLTAAASPKPRVQILGVRGALSTNLFEQVAFYRDDLEPAIDRGFGNLEDDELEALYDEARRLGRRRAFAGADVLLPNVTMRLGPLGVGAGLFAHSLVRYRFEDAGAGAPAVNFAAQGDLTGLASGAWDLSPLSAGGLSLGLTAKVARRYLSVKDKSLDAIDEDEDIHLLKADALGLDVGFRYTVDLPLPGRLHAGLAVFDAASTGFDYAYDRTLVENGRDETSGAAAQEETRLIAQEEALANERYALHPSYRAGLAYTAPSFLGLFGETGLALDYLGYKQPRVEQSFLAHLRLGMQVRVGRLLAVRAGLSQGYPTAGAGLELGFARLDYAFYGFEEGRLPGQVPSYNHTLRLAFGLF